MIAWASTFNELVKLGAVSDDQARAALERLDALEAAKPTGGQALRYGALGAGAGLVSRGLGDAIEHGMGGAIGKLAPGRYGAAAVTGGLMAGATPMIRSALDRRAEAGKLRAYLEQPPTSITPAGVDIPDVQPKLAASAPEKSKGEGHPNLKKYLIGGGISTGGLAANLGLGAVLNEGAKSDVGPHSSALYDKLKGEASVPVLENELGPGASMFVPHRKNLGMLAGALGPEGGQLPEGPQVHVGAKSPSILAHELGHAGINQSRVGRAFQNNATIRAGMHAQGLGAAAGLASGALSDDPRVHHAALAVPALASLPTLGYEAAATISAMRRLRGGGADPAQMSRAMKTLAPAWGTYAMRTAVGTGGALANQGIGGAIRHKVKSSKEKKAMDTMTFAAFADEVQQIKAGGVFDKLMNGLGMANRGGNMVGGTSGTGPSQGFQAFQQQQQKQQMPQAPAAPPARAMAPQPAMGGAPRALPPMNQPLNPGGMNMLFAPKPRPQMMAPPGGMR